MPIKNITDKLGWGVSLLLGLFFLGLGQYYFFAKGEVLLGIYAMLTCLILAYWLIWRQKIGVPLWTAVITAATLIIYHWVLKESSIAYGVMSATKMFPVVAGMLLVFTLHLPWKTQPIERLNQETNGRRAVRILGWMAALIFIFICIVRLARIYLAPYDYTAVINFFFVSRAAGVLGGDIPSAIFTQWWRLWVPLTYLGLLVFSYWWILNRQERLGVGKSLLIIYVLGNLGGICIAFLSTNGWSQFGLEVKSIHYHFYTVAKSYETFHEVWALLSTFAKKEIFQFVSFPMSHPPLNIIWNWVLIHLTGDNPTLIGLIIGAVAWTGVFPMYLIGKELYNREFGYYLAGFYAVTPNILIINHIALDGNITMFFAWAMAMVIMGTRRRGHGFMFLGGLAVAGFALTHYSVPVIMPSLFIMAVIGLRSMGKPGDGFFSWCGAALVKTAVFLAGFFLPFLILGLTTQWKFDYLAMQNYVVYTVYRNNIPLHPWFVGSWLAWVNYFIFVGVPIMALFIIRWLDVLRGDWRNDPYPWAGIITMIVPFILAIARQEAERAYMIFDLFIITTAALSLWQGSKPLRYMLKPKSGETVLEMGGGWRGMFLLMLALSYINAMVIEMLVVDHF